MVRDFRFKFCTRPDHHDIVWDPTPLSPNYRQILSIESGDVIDDAGECVVRRKTVINEFAFLLRIPDFSNRWMNDPFPKRPETTDWGCPSATGSRTPKSKRSSPVTNTLYGPSDPFLTICLAWLSAAMQGGWKAGKRQPNAANISINRMLPT